MDMIFKDFMMFHGVMRYFFLTLGIGCMLVGCKAPQESALPNILILVADDAGWEDFGFNGNEYVVTPHLDQLAKNGKVSDNAFLTIAQCSPSRLSILSGLYPHSTGAEDLHMPISDSITLLPSYLKEKNYYTGLLKKSHLGPNGDAQFDFIDPSLDSFDTFIDQSDERPFFLWVGFTDPHRPYKDSIFEKPQSPQDVKILPYWNDDEATRKDLANYYDEIRRMDQRIGSYVTTLVEKKMLDNTLIIFISDNGAPFPRAKGTTYDAGIKTPLVMHWPDQIQPNQRTNALISMVDLAPSILEMIGVESKNELDGAPVGQLFANGKTQSRDYIFAERNWHNCDEHIRSVRTSRYKLIRNAYLDVPHGTAADISSSPAFKSLLSLKQMDRLNHAQLRLFEYPRPEYELYDLQNDPYELENLADNEDYTIVRNDLIHILDRWVMETNDFPSTARRRNDNTDRFTGVKFDQIKLPSRIN